MISTKNARFITFPNLRQNSVNAFEIKYFHATNCATSAGATSTDATSTGGLCLRKIGNLNPVKEFGSGPPLLGSDSHQTNGRGACNGWLQSFMNYFVEKIIWD